ncbi:hypothetical protein L6452_42331 [Arctium lappa]|uniref:Uncharacterized protein n=1 Tax=Arctium lappa TaxID=4217 RepID=A0ACB8XJ41_ARCLA|nr:hypothetical protein L6452_42331 [Arctium lappa]
MEGQKEASNPGAVATGPKKMGSSWKMESHMGVEDGSAGEAHSMPLSPVPSVGPAVGKKPNNENTVPSFGPFIEKDPAKSESE